MSYLENPATLPFSTDLTITFSSVPDSYAIVGQMLVVSASAAPATSVSMAVLTASNLAVLSVTLSVTLSPAASELFSVTIPNQFAGSDEFSIFLFDGQVLLNPTTPYTLPIEVFTLTFASSAVVVNTPLVVLGSSENSPVVVTQLKYEGSNGAILSQTILATVPNSTVTLQSFIVPSSFYGATEIVATAFDQFGLTLASSNIDVVNMTVSFGSAYAIPSYPISISASSNVPAFVANIRVTTGTAAGPTFPVAVTVSASPVQLILYTVPVTTSMPSIVLASPLTSSGISYLQTPATFCFNFLIQQRYSEFWISLCCCS